MAKPSKKGRGGAAKKGRGGTAKKNRGGTPKKNYVSLDKAVENYIASARQAFTITDMLEQIHSQVNPKTKDLQKQVEKRLTGPSRQFFKDPDTAVYTPRQIYFSGAYFCISPTAEEIQQGILFIGHRFIPFASTKVSPMQYQIQWQGKQIERKKIRVLWQKIQNYYGLWSDLIITQLLVMEDSDNAKIVDPGGKKKARQELEVQVLDMAEVYKACNFQPGEHFHVKIEDWQNSVFSLEHAAAYGADTPEVQKQITIFTEKLAYVQKESGVLLDIGEQLSRALFYCGKNFLASPLFHLQIFAEKNPQFELLQVGLFKSLWKRGEIPASLFPPASDEFDLGRQLISFPIAFYEASIRDLLYNGANSPQELIDGISVLPLENPKDNRAEIKQVKALWHKLQAQYDRSADVQVGSYRNKVLELFFRTMGCLAPIIMTLSLNKKTIPVDLQTMIYQNTQLLETLKTIVYLMNAGDQALPWLGTRFQENLERYTIMVVEFEKKAGKEQAMYAPAFEDWLDDEDDEDDDDDEEMWLTPHSKKNKKKPQVDEKSRNTVYQLKVTLEDTQPPIWRRIQITGDATLGDVHAIMQIVMGWQDEHMHAFTINKFEYGSPMQEFEGRDEDSYTLSEVVTGKGMKFRYEYDFGDGWSHQIVVEKIMPCESGQTYPVCLDGAGACPPEDCGGVPGFYDMLEVLKNPKSEEYEEISEWLGDSFDPTLFEIEEVNRELRHLSKD